MLLWLLCPDVDTRVNSCYCGYGVQMLTPGFMLLWLLCPDADTRVSSCYCFLGLFVSMASVLFITKTGVVLTEML